MKYIKDSILKYIPVVLLILCFCSVTDLMAPETTERDVFGYESYHVEESGAICDREGVIKGWVQGNVIYDSQWNMTHQIRGNRLQQVGG